MKNKHSGYLLLEALIALVLLSLTVVSVFPTINFMIRRAKRSSGDVTAGILLQNAFEVTYRIFLNDWNAYPNGTYKIVQDLTDPTSPRWSLEATQTDVIQAKYTRVVEIKPVQRDGGTGAAGSGNPDPNSREVVTQISWTEAGVSKTIEAKLLLLNFNAL